MKNGASIPKFAVVTSELDSGWRSQTGVLCSLSPSGLDRALDLNTGVCSDPGQQQQDDFKRDTQPEPNQGTTEPRNGPPIQNLIEFRMKQLHNRRFLLLKTEGFRKKAEDNRGRTAEGITGEDSEELCELEAIQKELEELQIKREELKKQGKNSNGQQDMCPPFYTNETPSGGIYVLPPSDLTQDAALEGKVRTRPGVPNQSITHRPTEPAVPVDSLGQTSAFTQCPYCQEFVLTETRHRVGDATWILCCLCSAVGCAAGCCLIPFFMDRLKDVQHLCPHCQEHIHTFQRF